MVRFLVRVGVKAGGGELTQFVEHCLCGGFIGDGSANVVLFKEVAETGEIACARERGKGLGWLVAEKSFRSGGNAHGVGV